MQFERLGDGPLISAETCDSIGTNIQGPSLIAAPSWLEKPLGTYYLYFADHKGGHIRLAYADSLTGPWQVYCPGALQLQDSCFLTTAPNVDQRVLDDLHEKYRPHLGPHYTWDDLLEDALTPHIASPDVHVDHERQQIVMYFHGLEELNRQVTRVATSADGIDFTAQPEVLGSSYFRVFEHDGFSYAIEMPGRIRRSTDGRTGFEQGPTLFEPRMRHCAVRVRDNTLDVFWTRAGDSPESILWSTIDISGDWMDWSESEPVVLAQPELAYEGADKPVEPSRRGAIQERVCQLRDPAVFIEDATTYLLYAVAGESGIGLARITD